MNLFFLGARHALPVVCGYVPVGIAYAVYAAQTGFSPAQILAMSLLSYSGSGQFLTVSLAAQHADILALALGVFLMNFRYFIMSTCVFGRFAHLPVPGRLGMSFFVTDETFAIFTTAKAGLVTIAYFLGLFLTSYAAWFSGAFIGVVASDLLPQNVILAMGIALYALFIAIIMPGCRRDRLLCLLVLFTAGLNTLLCQVMSMSWAVVISTVAGAGIGAAAGSRRQTQGHGREPADLTSAPGTPAAEGSCGQSAADPDGRREVP